MATPPPMQSIAQKSYMCSSEGCPAHVPWLAFTAWRRPVEPLPLYRPRDPQASDLWRLMDQHFDHLPAGLRRAVCGQVRLLAAGRRALRGGLSQVRRSAPGLRPRPLPGLPARDVRGLFLQAALHLPLLPPETGPADRPSTWPKRSALPSPTGKWSSPSPNACGCTPASIASCWASSAVMRLDVHPGRSPPPARPRGRAARHGRRHPDPR